MIGNRFLATPPSANWDRLGQTRHWESLLTPSRAADVTARAGQCTGIWLYSVWGADSSEDGAEDPALGQVLPPSLSS